MACPGENTITAFLGGALTQSRIAAVESHLEGCAECRDLLRMTATRDERQPGARGPATLAPGDRVDDYLLEAVLGAGGMGVVYAATDLTLRRRVALKVPNLPARAAPGFLERFRVEARSMARMSHHNVVTIYRVGEFPGGVFIAMELIQGETARAWLRQRRSPREVRQVFLQAARGLAAAHGVGLVHRDFKPDNVLVGDDGRVCVSDFGVAWVPALQERLVADAPQATRGAAHDARLTQDGWALGSPAYMAPEQMLGSSVDAKTDVFSYCVSLYEALCGERPFAGATLSGLSRAIHAGATARGPLQARTTAALCDAILRGLSAAPGQRPALVELIGALHESPDLA